MSETHETAGPEQTEALAAGIAATLAGGATFLLSGDLGAGKTCFVRGLARGLGIDPRKVRSPTYAILHRYEGGRRVLAHFDAYFVREADEFRRTGLDEFLAAGEIVAVEWGERFAEAFPPDAIRVRMDATGEETRRIVIERPAPRPSERP